MTPDFSFYPFFDQRETRTRMPNPEIVHPTAQYRIDPLNNDFYRPTDELSEDFPELCK
jgi:hypothetical protein